MTGPVLLVNTNVARPPVSPVGLEYVGEALRESGFDVTLADLSFEPDWRTSLRTALAEKEPLLVGVGVRNTDDCCFLSAQSFLPWIAEVVRAVRESTSAPVFLGGSGFSTMPDHVLGSVPADAGIEGDGEGVLSAVARRVAEGKQFSDLPNVVWRSGRRVVRNGRTDVDLRRLPPPRRRLFDNRRYQDEGAMVGVETKRGCGQKCIFCADPLAKGNSIRLRPPQTVVDELRDLVDQGVTWFHLCDSEFNLPPGHAREVCRAILSSGLQEKIRWYCYCSPSRFDHELAALMKRAGCAGVNFGVDALSDEQLRRLGKPHTWGDVQQVAADLDRAGLNYMFDLLLGGPGETEDTVRTTIESAQRLGASVVGVSWGVRVWPGTPLADAVAQGQLKDGLYPQISTLGQPQFYLSPALAGGGLQLVEEFTREDPRFFVLTKPADERSYNYAGDDVLCGLIQAGARGAYWDILKHHTLPQ
ncbi:MAG: B12-binding domain-containing radical SAM protein [Chloroflexota bacterium]